MSVKTGLLIFVLVLNNVCGRPSVDNGSDPLSVCYSLKCPRETTICGKHSEISEVDKSKLLVHISCYDATGNIIKSTNSTEDNPFGPNVYYKGTRYSAVIKLSPSYSADGNSDDVDGEKESDFLPSYPNASSGPESEVEDLNN